MSSRLEDLLNDLANLDAQQDVAELRRVRELIINEHSDSEAATEALYRLGLDLLFRDRNVAQALHYFEEATKQKRPYWSDAARTSMALCMYHQGRSQKAYFELRKVAYQSKPNQHSVTALGFLETLLHGEGNYNEVKRVRKDRIVQLEKLVESSREANDAAARGYFLWLLGQALQDQGEQERAKSVLQQAKQLGPDALGADLYQSVAAALSNIS